MEVSRSVLEEAARGRRAHEAPVHFGETPSTAYDRGDSISSSLARIVSDLSGVEAFTRCAPFGSKRRTGLVMISGLKMRDG